MSNEQYLPAADNLSAIITILEREYGSPQHGNKENPLDELIYIKLSQQTNAPKFLPLYEALQNRYPSWRGLERASEEELEEILRPGGFHRQRAAHLKAIASRIVEDCGRLDLYWLRDLPPAEAIEYLKSLPGIGIKTALCVSMYSLGHDVLPVDVHVQRISERLGIMPSGLSDQKKHEWLSSLIPQGKRFSYHVTCVSHGRKVCRKKPKCHECCIRVYCAFFQKQVSAEAKK